MKLEMKRRILTGVVTAALVTTMAIPAYAAELTVKNNADNYKTIQAQTSTGLTFKDVPSNHWAYNSIMILTEKGIMNGVKTPVNNVGEFAPDAHLTYGEVITIATKLVAPDYIKPLENSDHWAVQYYSAATKSGILPEHAEDLLTAAPVIIQSVLNDKFTRDNMADILVRTAAVNGETLNSKEGIENNIADYYAAANKEAVKKVFSNGLLKGKDSAGNFKPKDYLTRAEASIVFCRLMNYIPRDEVTVIQKDDKTYDLSRVKQDLPDYFKEQMLQYGFTQTSWTKDRVVYTTRFGTVKENYYPSMDDIKNRPNTTLDYNNPWRSEAKVGDKIIVSGKTYDVIAHPAGIPDVHGTIVPYVKGIALDAGIATFDYGIIGDKFGPALEPGTSSKIHSSETYTINKYTGEGYWASQWGAIYKKSPQPIKDGTKDGQLSPDGLWIWSEVAEIWGQTGGIAR